MKTTGERIRQARTARGWSGQKLATLCGYKRQSAISNLENRIGGTGGNKIRVIATQLGVPLEWLMNGPDSDLVPFLPGTFEASFREAVVTLIHPPTAEEPRAAYHDPWIAEAVAILQRLQQHEKQGALANLRTYVHNLGPPQKHDRPEHPNTSTA